MTPFSLVAGDFNGDSDPDLAVANSFPGTFSILAGGPGGGFAAPIPFASAPDVRSIAVADLNADGDPDLAGASLATDSAVVLTGGPGAGFGAPATFAVGDNPWSLTARDFDSDSKPDLAVTNINENSVSVLLNTGRPAAAVAARRRRVRAATPGRPERRPGPSR